MIPRTNNDNPHEPQFIQLVPQSLLSPLSSRWRIWMLSEVGRVFVLKKTLLSKEPHDRLTNHSAPRVAPWPFEIASVLHHFLQLTLSKIDEFLAFLAIGCVLNSSR